VVHEVSQNLGATSRCQNSPHIFGVIVQNLATTATWCQGFVHLSA